MVRLVVMVLIHIHHGQLLLILEIVDIIAVVAVLEIQLAQTNLT
jgi:hypothetical protein